MCISAFSGYSVAMDFAMATAWAFSWVASDSSDRVSGLKRAIGGCAVIWLKHITSQSHRPVKNRYIAMLLPNLALLVFKRIRFLMAPWKSVAAFSVALLIPLKFISTKAYWIEFRKNNPRNQFHWCQADGSYGSQSATSFSNTHQGGDPSLFLNESTLSRRVAFALPF